MDRSAQGDLLRISFNISFPSLSCEFATLDVSDALGTKRLNLTKTIRKLPIGQARRRSCHRPTHFFCFVSADMSVWLRQGQLLIALALLQVLLSVRDMHPCSIP